MFHPDQIRHELANTTSREAAHDYLAWLRPSKSELLQLAQACGVNVTVRDTMGAMRDAIVEQKVGARLDHEAIQTAAW